MSPSPNYWCTWSTQSARLPAARDALAPLFAGDKSRPTTRDSLCEKVLFGPKGWTGFYPESRAGLYLLLDDGWDVAYGAHPDIPPGLAQFGAMTPDPGRFPSLSGTPGERLAELSRRVTDAGWRGLGLWVAIQSQGDMGIESWRGVAPREEWKRKIAWCAEGGVSYLKVDWGASCGDIAFRQMLTEIKNEIAPDIVIEHCRCQPPVNGLNDDGTGGGRRLVGPEDAELREWERQVLPFSDTWRIYDWIEPLSFPQGIDRTVTDIRLAEETGAHAIVSTEDGLYLGAALGCAFGVMRSPLRPPDDRNWPTLPCRRLREVDRAVRWERLAPAYAPRADFRIVWSDEALFDSWQFAEGAFWYRPVCGKPIRQGAPARVARGLPLPEVAAEGDAPYVLASRNPAGPLAVAALPRIIGGKSVTPPADVRIGAALAPEAPLGVFGAFRSVTLRASAPVEALFAQDLAGGPVHDIRAAVPVTDGHLVLPGDLLARIGSELNGDDSMPATLVWTERPPASFVGPLNR